MDKLILIDTSNYIFDEKLGIYSKFRKKWCKGYIDERTNYLTVKLKCIDGKRRSFQYHRVMCYFFKPIPKHLWKIPLEKLEIDHILPVSNGGTNELSNLRWCTNKENNNNKFTRNNKSKALLNRNDESKIVYQYTLDNKLVGVYKSQSEAARQNNLSQTSISRCCYGGSYDNRREKWVNMKQYNGYKWSFNPL